MRFITLAFIAAFIATTATAQPAVERGRYLVETIAGCGNCHTPKGPNAPPPGKTLAGGNVLVDIPAFTAIAANITPDRETGLGGWTDDQLFLAIREGKRPDGSLIGPPMPISLYRGLADDDVRAMIAYLRTVPPVHNVAAKSTYRIKLPPAYGPPVGTVNAPPKSDKVAYGAYLAGPVGHCIACHTPMLKGQRDMSRVGAGGQTFSSYGGTAVASNITGNKMHGLGDWSDAQIERAIRTGISVDGRKLVPVMAFTSYNSIAPDDMAALIAYVRSLPAVD
jgi:mono/diheme cytochrome c family protein